MDAFDVELRKSLENDGRSDLQQLIHKSVSVLEHIDNDTSFVSQKSITNKNKGIDDSQHFSGNNSKTIYKLPSSVQHFNDCKATTEIKSSTHISSGINRVGREKITQTCLSPTALKIKNTNAITETNTPTRTRKRIPSSSTDDSILDTNSEAQDLGESTADSLVAIDVLGQKSSLYRKGRPWGPKRKRPCYVAPNAENIDERGKDEISLPEKEKMCQSQEWQPKGFHEKEFDCSSMVSEDVFM